MPVTVNRAAACGCTPNVENSPETWQPCSNCGQCDNHCECEVCERCRGTFFIDDYCTTCNRCFDDCRCLSCEAQGCGTRGPVGVVCQRCYQCTSSAEDHCSCYRCLSCGDRFTSETWHDRCERCTTHCACFNCHSCGVRDTNRCRNCLNCSTHCNCVQCTGCGRRVAGNHVCPDCNACTTNACCRCNAQGVPFRKGKFKIHESRFDKGQFKKNPIRRHISVEAEVDGYDKYRVYKKLNKALDNWSDAVVSDGSVPYGFEINTNPCAGDRFLEHINDLAEGFKEGGFPKPSESCGLHVHVNVKGQPLFNADGTPKMKDNSQMFDAAQGGYTHYELLNLIRVYDKVEPAFFALCHPRRLNARYSLVCGDFYITKHVAPKEFRKEIAEKLYNGGSKLPQVDVKKGISGSTVAITGKQIVKNKNTKYQSVRYKALNIHSYFLRGTIEFRHHEGTVDGEVITNYALICATLVDKAAKMTFREIEAMPSDPREALLSLLPAHLQEYAKKRWKEHDELVQRESRWRVHVDNVWKEVARKKQVALAAQPTAAQTAAAVR